MDELTLEQVTEKVKELGVGQTIILKSDKERRHALIAARVLPKRIVTKGTKGGQYTVTALPGE